jgi:hypothetical protein
MSAKWFDALMDIVVGIGVVAAFPAMIVAILMTLKPNWEILIPVALTLAFLSPVFWAHRVSIPGKPRRLLFKRDGSMPAPLGLRAYGARHKCVSGHHADIVSIEAKRSDVTAEAQNFNFSYRVVLYKRSGDMTYVASCLQPDEAHKVAVQLTQALRALHDEMANEHRRRGAQRHGTPATRVLID